jgi:hypothetical protein
MRFQEVMQDMQQHPRMGAIAATVRDPDIIDDHVAQTLAAVRLIEQVLRKCSRRNLRNVLVLGYRRDFFTG